MAEFPEQLHAKLKSCRTLPSVPGVVIQILDLCERDEVGVPEIARVLSRDPALTTKLLKVANSAYYGVRSEVSTVSRAISILGINATLSLALSFSFVRNLRKSGKTGFDHRLYWRRSVISSAAARAIAGGTRDGNRDEMFLAGLLQDIGMLVLSEAIPALYDPLAAASGRCHEKLVELEREALGIDHAAVGAWFLERWNLPERLRIAVEASHDPEKADGTEEAAFCRSVALAGRVAEIWTNPDTASAAGVALKEAGYFLEMPVEKLDGLLGEVAVSLPEITSILEVDIGGDDIVQRLLDQAREALVVLNLRAQQQMRDIQDLAQRDGLTSLHNRAYLEDLLPQYFGIAVRTGLPLSILFLDLDHFKVVNDTYGHQVGDRVLVSVAQVLRSAVRAADIVARYGGEEFVCLLPNTGESGARLLAERLRAGVEASPHRLDDGREIAVTLSAGCATFSSENPFNNVFHLLRIADRCLYAAKYAGRNCVVTPDRLPEIPMEGSHAYVHSI